MYSQYRLGDYRLWLILGSSIVYETYVYIYNLHIYNPFIQLLKVLLIIKTPQPKSKIF